MTDEIIQKHVSADILAREFYVEMRTGLFTNKAWDDLDADTKATWIRAANHVVRKGWTKAVRRPLTDIEIEGHYNCLTIGTRLRLAANTLIEAGRRRYPNADQHHYLSIKWDVGQITDTSHEWDRQDRQKAVVRRLTGFLEGSIGTVENPVVHTPTAEDLAERLVKSGWISEIPTEADVDD